MTTTKQQETDAWTRAFIRLTAASYGREGCPDPAIQYGQSLIDALHATKVDESRLDRVVEVIAYYVLTRGYPVRDVIASAIAMVELQDMYIRGEDPKRLVRV